MEDKLVCRPGGGGRALKVKKKIHKEDSRIHLLSPDKLVDSLAPVVLHVLAILDLLDDVIDLGPTHGLVIEGLGLLSHDFGN